MSYAEITQALATADNALLHSLLEAGGAPQRASLSRDELLAALLAELTAMGVEDLLDKLSEGTKRQAQADGAAGELEDAVKRDVIAFLEAASFPLVRKMAREAGLRVSADDDVGADESGRARREYLTRARRPGSSEAVRGDGAARH